MSKTSNKPFKGNTSNLSEMKLEALSRQVAKNHDQLRKALNVIPVYLKAANVDDGKTNKSLKKLDSSFEHFRDLVANYIKTEEEKLFPYVNLLLEKKSKGEATKKSILTNLKNTQEKIKKGLTEIRELSANYTVNGNYSPSTKLCFAHMFNFEQDMFKHLFVMESIFLPRMQDLERSIAK